jgi:hypothetical protein
MADDGEALEEQGGDPLTMVLVGHGERHRRFVGPAADDVLTGPGREAGRSDAL